VVNFKVIWASGFSGFDPQATRDAWQKALAEQSIYSEFLNPTSLTGMMVLLGMLKGNRYKKSDLEKLQNPELVYAVIRMFKIDENSAISPARLALSFPFISLTFALFGLYVNPVTDPKLEPFLAFPGGASLCTSEKEFNSWVAWAKSFNKIINTKQKWDAKVWEQKEKDVETYAKSAYDGRRKTTNTLDDNELFKKRELYVKAVADLPKDFDRQYASSIDTVTAMKGIGKTTRLTGNVRMKGKPPKETEETGDLDFSDHE